MDTQIPVHSVGEDPSAMVQRGQPSLPRLFDMNRSLPNLTTYAQLLDAEVHQKVPSDVSNAPSVAAAVPSVVREPRSFQRYNSEASSTLIPGRSSVGVAPLTYKDTDGAEWYVRGPANGIVPPFETEPEAAPQSVDRFGFVVESTPSGSHKSLLDAKSDLLREERRTKKWRAMLGSDGTDWKRYVQKKPRELKRRIRKGIPDCMRGLVWQLISGSRELLKKNQGLYEHLVLYESSNSELDIIRDINRTFPSHVYFQQRHGPGQRSLYNVLKAYAVYDRDVGYVQGMGFLAGIMLLYMGEEDAFWLLVALLKGAVHEPMQGLYLNGLPLVQLYLWQFERLVQECMPRLGSHLKDEMIAPSMYASQWFITVFSYSFPFSLALRIWDVFLFEGMGVVFKVGLALLKIREADLLQQPFESLVQNLRRFPDDILLPSTLLPVAFSIKVSARLKELHAEYEFINSPKATAAPAPAGGMKVDEEAEEEEEPADPTCGHGTPSLGLRKLKKAVSAAIFQRK